MITEDQIVKILEQREEENDGLLGVNCIHYKSVATAILSEVRLSALEVKEMPNLQDIDLMYEKCDERVIQASQFYIRGFDHGAGCNAKEIPKSIKWEGLTQDEIIELIDISYNVDYAVVATEKKVSEKFALYLGNAAKGLPTWEDFSKIVDLGLQPSIPDNELPRRLFNYLHQQVSTLLISRDEMHKKEMEELVKFYEWTSQNGWWCERSGQWWDERETTLTTEQLKGKFKQETDTKTASHEG